MSPAAFAAHPRRPIRHLIVSLLMASSLLALAACTSSTPAAPAKPAPTQGAAKPTSSPSAAKPSASPGASPQASPSPSPRPEALLQILDATLADATPWVSLRLTEGEPLIVSGWRLEVGNQAIVIPGNAIIQPGDTLTLRAGEGQSSDREIFLGAESYALALAATPGARVRLVNPTGEVAAETTVPRF
jgi:hypothetical protein